jgi:hypothetical protein
MISKFEQSIQENLHCKPVLLRINPVIEKMPIPMRRYDEPFLPFTKAIIQASRNYVIGYIFDFAAYLALGAAGVIALERSIAYANGKATILDGAFADSRYVAVVGDMGFSVDAVTVKDRSISNVFDNRGISSVLVEDINKTTMFVVIDGQSLTLKVMGDNIIYADLSDNFEHSIGNSLREITFD